MQEKMNFQPEAFPLELLTGESENSSEVAFEIGELEEERRGGGGGGRGGGGGGRGGGAGAAAVAPDSVRGFLPDAAVRGDRLEPVGGRGRLDRPGGPQAPGLDVDGRSSPGR